MALEALFYKHLRQCAVVSLLCAAAETSGLGDSAGFVSFPASCVFTLRFIFTHLSLFTSD